MEARLEASPALLAANRRLEELRAVMGARRRSTDTSVERPPLEPGDITGPGQSAIDMAMANDMVGSLPPHLGWGSTTVTTAIRAWLKRQRKAATMATSFHQPAPPSGTVRETPPDSCSPTDLATSLPTPLPTTVKLYPDIALGMLRSELAAPGRIWLLLRHLDQAGQGMFRIATIKQQLTKKESPQRVCGWRQLRNLLRQGEGVFWQRDRDRIWLRSAAKAAAGLGVARLAGWPVAFPVRALLGGMGEVRAHLYASFHSGRVKKAQRSQQQKPIARATLEQLTGVTPQGQRLYEMRAGVTVLHNYAVGEQTTVERHHERAWQRGGGVFELTDHLGQQGRKGGSYLAWQLPNSYQSNHRQRPKGQQKRINRQLADLFMKGMTGNDSEAIERRYFDSPAQAVKAHGKSPQNDLYWQRHRTRDRSGLVWQVIRLPE